MKMRNALRILAAAGLGTALLAQPALAQTWPTKIVRIVTPTSPGGPSDILARLLAQKLTESLGQQVIVENKPGGGQMIGTDFVAKAEPDGHTLLLVNDGAIAINPSLYSKMPYDPQKDLAPVTLIADLPMVMVVHPDLPAKSVKDLIDLAKAKPGTLNFAAGGSTSQFSGELFRLAAGLDMVHVGYKGSGQAVAAVVGGETQLMFDGIASSLPHIKSGRLRALGVTSEKPLAELPGIPVVGATVPGYTSGTWLGVLTAAATPKPVIAKLRAEIGKVVAMPDIREKLVAMGMYPVMSQPEEFAATIKSDTAKWAKVIREAKIPKVE
jgi:tripartite-type tricarboxylate transporter receptor subunit TctC